MLFEALLPLLFVGALETPMVPQVPMATLNMLTIAPPSDKVRALPELSAAGVYIVDNATGQSIAQKNGQVSMPMASITKLMTALVIAESHSVHEIVTIPEQATAITGQKVYLKAGDQYTVGDLLSATLMPSANDAAIALAIHHSGTLDAFVNTMNERAKSLGLDGTSYANPTGLDDPMQFSTAKDVAALDRYVNTIPALKRRMSRSSDVITSKNGTVIRLVHSHQSLQRDHARASTMQVEAGKTGTTNKAGECLVSTVSAGAKDYTVVLLGSARRYADLERILRSLEAPVLAYHSS